MTRSREAHTRSCFIWTKRSRTKSPSSPSTRFKNLKQSFSDLTSPSTQHIPSPNESEIENLYSFILSGFVQLFSGSVAGEAVKAGRGVLGNVDGKLFGVGVSVEGDMGGIVLIGVDDVEGDVKGVNVGQAFY